MKTKNPLDVGSGDEIRKWPEKNHETESECRVAVRRGRLEDDGTFWHVDAVEEAMRFGWFDGTTKTAIDAWQTTETVVCQSKRKCRKKARWLFGRARPS